MKKSILFLLLVAAAACAQSANPQPGQQPGSRMRQLKLPQAEYDAVKAEIDDLAKAWNAGNLPAMSAHMADEVQFITPTGRAIQDKKEIDQYQAELMKKHFAGSRLTSTILQTRFVRPRVGYCDVQVTITHYKSLPPGISVAKGQPLRLLTRYLLTKEGRDWVIAAVQSTVVRESVKK